MSASMLYHAFGIRGYRHLCSKYVEDKIVLKIAPTSKTCRCPASGGNYTILKSSLERRFRGPPIGRKKVIIVLQVSRVKCRDCNVIRQAKIGFANPRRTYIRSFERYALSSTAFTP